MKITDIITKHDLDEPYGRLSRFLDLDEIIKLEQLYGGRQIRFRRDHSGIEEEYPELVTVLGIEKAKQVAKGFSGELVYFPALRKSASDKIKTMILSEYNGYNHKQLARKFGYCERHIRNILSAYRKNEALADYNQLSLYDIELS